MEYKSLPFEVKEVTADGRFWGHASAFGNEDDTWPIPEIVDRGAFAKTLQERAGRIRICHQHDWKDVIGKPVVIHEDEKGLFVDAQLVMDVQRAREDHALLKAGALGELSIGYETVKADTVTEGGKSIRHLKEIKLYEISLVTLAANARATVLGVKASATSAEPEQPREEVIAPGTGDISPAAAEPDDSPLTAQVATVTPSAKLELHQLLVKYGGKR